ncbi:MAG TPA: prephenate dehydrogenase/arogenate dehydrogenase family protein [Candidatus Eremiobacteraceae bacterium]|nr:prephenate dehydrogenase/arogenate dehydrogenase family protein [Candidatus Eremiobacteraceae bacterium]
MRERRSNRIAILGTGLIGGSIGLAARAAGYSVEGWDTDRHALRTAKRRGAIDHAAKSLEAAVADKNIVVLAAPLDAILKQLPAVFSYATSGALIIDCAGVKMPVVQHAVRMLKRWPAVRFVAGHPIAGSERSGAKAASASLLKERVFALYAPPQRKRAEAWSDSKRFARRIGMEPFRADPRMHDRAIAGLSALPQLAATALALSAAPHAPRAWARIAGPGYRDATRLAASHFSIWRPGLEANRREVLRSIERLAKRVHGIETALRRRDWQTLMRIFSGAAKARRRVYPN